ncbi:hypothetical protein F9K97_18840 [Brucella anthropi]|uniref:hypothetical protein n=1 Tax=Brucella TaxID=234 RepID=UPI00124D58E5|nr:MULTISPECIES: hypothetical protein [Brucella]KAB2784135.1 hypothetical protein F9K97_18840 [Brucella anthropi]KAB2793155.1 hypothetical protein F9K87_21125 [Brucella anthropi]QNQ64449.1 hypothetical protein IB024_16685 [Brucella sp. 6810]
MASNRQQSERLRKQRERQKDYRDRLRAERKPTRDDIARVLLHFMIVKAVKSGNQDGMEKLIDMLLDALKGQGFDKDASLEVIDDLIVRYTKSGWDFRRKVHLSAGELVGDTEH